MGYPLWVYIGKLIDTGVAIILKCANYVAEVKYRKVDMSASGSGLFWRAT